MIKEFLELRKQIQKVIFNFGEQVTSDGLTIVSKDDVLVEGSEVFVYDDMGVLIPLENGNYTFEDGSTIEVLDGLVKTVKEGEVEVVEPVIEDVEPTEVPLEEELVDVIEEPIVEEPVVNPMEEVVSIIGDLLEKISELSTVVEGMKVQMSNQEEVIEKLSKFSKADVIVEKPEISEPNNKKTSRAERIISAK